MLTFIFKFGPGFGQIRLNRYQFSNSNFSSNSMPILPSSLLGLNNIVYFGARQLARLKIALQNLTSPALSFFFGEYTAQKMKINLQRLFTIATFIPTAL